MSRIKVLLFFLIVIGGVFVLYKLFPPYFAYFTFQDDLKNTVVRMQNSNTTDDEIKAAILKLAENHGLPVSEQQVHVARQGKSLSVSVDYQIHVDFPGYPVDLQFNPSTTNNMP